MKAMLLLQARTNSSRLPAKVLLPIAGVPLAVLAAKRAANTGHHVIVVTSSESTDDALCDVLQKWNIDYFRGALDNTLKRFVDALEAVTDEQVVVRLTGDNVVPDGAFIDEMLEDFAERGLDYLCCSGETSGLPYGVSAEVTRAGHLRNAFSQAKTSFDCEHVTPKVIERFGKKYFDRYSDLAMCRYRCTVDTLDDYLRICRLFAGIDKPEEATLSHLLTRLRNVSPEVVSAKAARRMVLGTAQFGMNYGITNAKGRPTQREVNSIVQTAISSGIEYIDTARTYGDSEQVLGKALSGGWDCRATIVTKLSPLDDCPYDAGPKLVTGNVEQSIYKSCHALHMQSLDVVMLHRAEHLTAWQGAAWRALINLKQLKVVKHLGVSVQSPEEALLALDFPDVEFIQLPFNILDYRWGAVVTRIGQVRQHRKLVVHARSALLQGLLACNQIDLWHKACCPNASEVIDWLRSKADVYTGGDIVGLALRYVCSQSWIDGVVVGVETSEQLCENLRQLDNDNWATDVHSMIILDRPIVPIETLNPAKWNQNNV